MHTNLFRANSDTQTDLHRDHLSSCERLEVRCDGKAEGLREMFSQSTKFRRVGRLWINVRATAIADKEQFSPAYHVLFADVVSCGVDTETVDAIKWQAIHHRFHAAETIHNITVRTVTFIVIFWLGAEYPATATVTYVNSTAHVNQSRMQT